jgi:aspartyl/asparaginyl beta-hydroxylase (cupin superfamily)
MQSTAGTPWSFVLQAGKRLRYVFDRQIARWSLVPTDPVLDPTLFAWTDAMRDQWEMIRDEAFAIMRAPGGVPTLAEVSPDHGRIALGGWRSFFLRAYDYPVPTNMKRCPGTSAALSRIPTLNSAFFSILAPGASIPDHRGPTKGIITCHLTLQTPSFDDCRLLIGGREVGWTEGEFLILDDSYRHEVSNKSDVTKVVLLIQVRRPSRWPGRLLIAMFLWGIRRSRFVQEARRNLTSWDAATARVEAAA